MLTAAEGFILGAGAKIFTIAGPNVRHSRERNIRAYLLDNHIVLVKKGLTD